MSLHKLKRPFMNLRLIFSLFLTAIFSLLLESSIAWANWELLPESYHQLYDTWGQFIDEQAALLNTGQARLWTSLGGTLPVIGDEESIHHPEFVLHASANAGLHYNDNLRIWTETLDVRLGFAVEWELHSKLRFSVGYTHFSAHTADGVVPADSDLIEPSVGQEFLSIRVVYDIKNNLRLAATIKPFVRSYPPVHPIWLDQSIEYFPWGAKDSRQFSPYLAFGLDESGIQGHSMTLTSHAQIGAYIGNHMSPGHRQTIRTVLGYYNGMDPRLKYFELRNAKQQFAYLGVMFDL